MANDFIVVSLGGSIVSGVDGVEIEKVKKLSQFFLASAKKGKKFVVVVGGGRLCRVYQEAAKKLKSSVTARELDWIGIYATRANASLLRVLLSKYAPDDIFYPNSAYKAKIKAYKVIVGAGTTPGWTSDMPTVMWAKFVGAKTIINSTNIDYVYSADPRTNKDAKPLKEMLWKDYLKLVGNKYVPGANWPFDPVAAREAQKLKIIVKVVNGNNIKELGNAISGKKFVGTVIK